MVMVFLLHMIAARFSSLNCLAEGGGHVCQKLPPIFPNPPPILPHVLTPPSIVLAGRSYRRQDLIIGWPPCLVPLLKSPSIVSPTGWQDGLKFNQVATTSATTTVLGVSLICPGRLLAGWAQAQRRWPHPLGALPLGL